MDNDHSGATKDLLDVDLDAIVEASKKRSRKKKQMQICLVAGIILCVAAGLIWFFTAQKNAQAAYEEGLRAMQAEDYEQAIQLFIKAGSYQDSLEKLADVQLAYDVLNSTTYADALYACETMLSISREAFGGDIDMTYEYDLETRAVISTLTFPEFSADPSLADLSSQLSGLENMIVQNLNENTKLDHERYLAEDIDVDCIFITYGENGSLAFQSRNGETEYDYRKQ